MCVCLSTFAINSGNEQLIKEVAINIYFSMRSKQTAQQTAPWTCLKITKLIHNKTKFNVEVNTMVDGHFPLPRQLGIIPQVVVHNHKYHHHHRKMKAKRKSTFHSVLIDLEVRCIFLHSSTHSSIHSFNTALGVCTACLQIRSTLEAWLIN